MSYTIDTLGLLLEFSVHLHRVHARTKQTLKETIWCTPNCNRLSQTPCTYSL